MAPFCEIAHRLPTAWFSRSWHPGAPLGEESGLQACYGKPCDLQGFPIHGQCPDGGSLGPVHHRCITSAESTTSTGVTATWPLALRRLVERKHRPWLRLASAQKGDCLMGGPRRRVSDLCRPSRAQGAARAHGRAARRAAGRARDVTVSTCGGRVRGANAAASAASSRGLAAGDGEAGG